MSATDLFLLLINIAVIHSGYSGDEVVKVMEGRAQGLLAHCERSASYSEGNGDLLPGCERSSDVI